MTNKEIASQILELVGGEKNISIATHCVTRLRLNLKENNYNEKALADIDGVLKVQSVNGQLQVVLGGKVEGVYNEFCELAGLEALPEVPEDDTNEKAKFSLNALIEAIASIFTPILPVLVGCGMVTSLTVLLPTLGIMKTDSGAFTVLQMIGQLIFYFLPFYLAVSSARKFKTNEYLAIALAGAYMYPTIMDGAAQAAATGIKSLDFFGLPVLFVNYKSTVIPIILSVWVMSYVYRFINKHMPDSLKIIFSGMLTLFVMVPLELIVLGPIGTYAGTYIANGIHWLYTAGGMIGAFVLGFIRPVLVMLGMHYALTPMMVAELAETGKSIIPPALIAGNLAQCGAAFAVFLLSKSSKEKSGALSASFSAFLGITEPAMYGYNLKYKKPFFCALTAAGLAAAYMSLFDAYTDALALPGILSLPTYHASSFIHIIIGVIISIVGACVLTLVTMGFGKKSKQEYKENTLYAPSTGKLIPLSEVNDEAFRSGSLGQGFAIVPTAGQVNAPVAGTVTAVFPTKHAIGLTDNKGHEFIIHIGIDTVQLNGKHFQCHVKQNDKVAVGDILVSYDMHAIQKAGYDTTTMVVVTNLKESENLVVAASTQADLTTACAELK